jgi:hypothetical protein
MLARISALECEIADIEHAEYLLGKERETAFDRARKAILPLFADTHDGLLGCTPVYLRAPDATYLIIDLSEDGFAPSNGAGTRIAPKHTVTKYVARTCLHEASKNRRNG